MRIGILTFHRACNCGAMLQAWALKSVLQRMGHMVEFPVCNQVGVRSRWRKVIPKMNVGIVRWAKSFCAAPLVHLGSFGVADLQLERYNAFRKKYLAERECVPEEFSKYYDLVIVGSDQVWNEKLTLSDAPLFSGVGIPDTVPIITYAASYGDKPLDDLSAKTLATALGRYSALSARENIVKEQMEAFTGRQIEVVADPTLLLGQSEYDDIATDPDIDGDYLYCYTVGMDNRMRDMVNALAARLGVKSVITPVLTYSRFPGSKNTYYAVSPDRMVGYTRRAKYVVASSFHGTVLGLIYNKPTVSLRTGVEEFESRPASLLNRIGMGNRVVNPNMDIDYVCEIMNSEYSMMAARKLSDFKVNSLNWLRKTIGACVEKD